MSSPNDTPLPPAPSGKIENVSPGNQPHNKWESISIHTAKCDVCSEHNTSVIQRCTRCNRQLCKKCIHKASDDGVHSANAAELNWTPQARAPVPRRSGSGGLAAKDKTSPPIIPSSSYKVTKPISRRSTRGCREKLMSEAEKRGGSIEDLFVEGSEKGSYDSDRNYDPEDDYDPGSETEEDPFLEERIKAAAARKLDDALPNTGSSSKSDNPRHGEDEVPSNGSSKKSVRWADADTASSKVDKGKGKARENVMQPSGLPRGPAPTLSPKASGSSRLAHIRATTSQITRSSSLPLTGSRAAPFEIDDIRRPVQGGFSEVIAKLAREKEEKRLRDEAFRERETMKARERAYQYEKKAAWEHDPLILSLRNQGKDQLAKEYMEEAGMLIRMRRGLP